MKTRKENSASSAVLPAAAPAAARARFLGSPPCTAALLAGAGAAAGALLAGAAAGAFLGGGSLRFSRCMGSCAHQADATPHPSVFEGFLRRLH
jgi:hypothetical protein